MKTFFTRWSIRNPVITVALYIGVLILSVLTLIIIPVRMMPYVQSPLVAVITRTPGSSPMEVETYISKPIEQRMTVLDGVRFVRSSSQQDLSLVTVQFAWGGDVDKAVRDVQSVMKSAEGDLPLDGINTRSYWVLPIDPLNRPVLTLALKAEGWDRVKLREFADNTLVDRLTNVQDVQSVFITGGYRRQLQVIVDRQKLAAYGLSILQVRDAIAMRAGEELDFPPGYGLDSMGDMTDMMIEFDRLLKGLIVSIILIYLILVIQFGSFIQPLVMMLSIPLQLIGVFGALLLAQQTLSSVSILGIIILSGISVSSAILLLELILTKRQEGVLRAEAIRQAAPVRLKAIFMTTLTTMIVIVRLAFYPETGMDAYSPIATVVLGGLTVSTLLTLIVIPIVYTFVDDITQGVKGLRRKRRSPRKQLPQP